MFCLIKFALFVWRRRICRTKQHRASRQPSHISSVHSGSQLARDNHYTNWAHRPAHTKAIRSRRGIYISAVLMYFNYGSALNVLRPQVGIIRLDPASIPGDRCIKLHQLETAPRGPQSTVEQCSCWATCPLYRWHTRSAGDVQWQFCLQCSDQTKLSPNSIVAVRR